MMKILLSLMFLFFFINKFNKMLIQMIYMIYLVILIMMMVVMFPFNNMNNWMKIYYIYGEDQFSYGLVVLSLWVVMLMILASNKMLNNSLYLYMYMINFMTIFLILCFISMNIMMFYVYFESSLIPIFLMILGWGYQVDRIKAGLYLILYTLVGSMPLFFVIIYLYMENYCLMMNMIMYKNLGGVIYLFLILAFLIKMPMYFFHLWLPKAHVEAPVVGSMILAGIMLKLGSYGLMRFMVMMLEMCNLFNKYFIIISLVGGIYSSLLCLYQIDMKMLVAYSSIVHMSLVLSGLMTLFNLGVTGGFLMMIAHGLCSSGLFYLVNVVYERSQSRSLLINKGMINIFPSLSLMWFLLCSSNLSFPPSLNFFSEIMLLNSLIVWSKMLMLVLMLLMFFSALYSLYLYSYSQHGQMNLMNFNFKVISVMEYILLLLHWIPLNILFYFMYLFV